LFFQRHHFVTVLFDLFLYLYTLDELAHACQAGLAALSGGRGPLCPSAFKTKKLLQLLIKISGCNSL
jgi:hypothetical protein